MPILSGAQRLATYGPLVTYTGGRGVAADQLRTVISPWGLRARLHRFIADHWLDTCDAAADEVPEFRPGRCDSFAPRNIRGSNDVSLHAYGLACDWFVTPLAHGAPAGGVWDPYELRTPEYRAWCQVWARHGWRLGARFTRRDTPHIEWAQGLPPRPAPRPTPPAIPTPALPTPAHFEEDAVEYAFVELAPKGYGIWEGWWDPGLGNDPVIVGATLHGPSIDNDGPWPWSLGATLRAQTRGPHIYVVAAQQNGAPAPPGDRLHAHVTAAPR